MKNRNTGKWRDASATTSGKRSNGSRTKTRSTYAGGTRTDATAHRREHQPDDLKVCGLIDGMELVHWLKTHPEWTTTGDWSDERYAAPVWITEAGRTALENRHLYDMEPVEGGLVEPGWRAKPRQQGYSSGHDALPGS